MSEEEATQALVREVGRRSVERLGEGLTRTVSEASALYRWLLTMLLLINGAGLYLCIAAREAIGPGLFGQVALLFFGGAMAAILAALVSIGLTLPATASIRKAITHWTDVSVSGELSAEALVSARQVKWMGLIWLVLTSLVVLISLVLFVVGADRLATRFDVLPQVEADAQTEPTPQASFSNAAHPLIQSNEAAGASATPVAAPTQTLPATPSAMPRAAQSPRPTPTSRATPAPPAPRPTATQPPPVVTPPSSTIAPQPAPTTP